MNTAGWIWLVGPWLVAGAIWTLSIWGIAKHRARKHYNANIKSIEASHLKQMGQRFDFEDQQQKRIEELEVAHSELESRCRRNHHLRVGAHYTPVWKAEGLEERP